MFGPGNNETETPLAPFHSSVISSGISSGYNANTA